MQQIHLAVPISSNCTEHNSVTLCIARKERTELPGHPAELSDSVKLLLTGAESHVFEIDPVLKSIN